MNIPLFDGHCDALYKLMATPDQHLTDSDGQWSLHRCQQFAPQAQIFAVFADSAQPDAEKVALHQRADEIIATLLDAGVVTREEAENGSVSYQTTVDLPDDFALDQPLSPFLLAALELLDPESETYALDVISMAEATLEDPPQILRAQQRAARDRAMAEMKADGVDFAFPSTTVYLAKEN